MLTGRDFSKFGSQYDVLSRLGDGNGDPVVGPVHVRFIGRHSIAAIGPEREVALMTTTGRVVTLFQNGIAIDEAAKLKQKGRNDAKEGKEDDDEVHYEYWFEDPVYVMSKEEKDTKAREEAELEKAAQAKELRAPTKRVTLQMACRDICLVPDHDSLRVGIACEHSSSLKIVTKEMGGDNWEETKSIGSRYIVVESTGARKPGLFSSISGIDSVRVEDQVLYFTCDEAANRIQVLNEEGEVVRSLQGEGPGNGQFRGPCSVSVHLVKKSIRIRDGVQEEKELQEKIAALEALKRMEGMERNMRGSGNISRRKKSFAVGLGKVRKKDVELHEAKSGFDHKDVLDAEDLDKLKASNTYDSDDSDDFEDKDPSEYIPSWYLGFADQQDLVSHLRTNKSSGKPGDFAVARRIDDPSIYDLYYLAKGGDVLARKKGSIVKLVLRKQEVNEYNKHAGIYLSTTTQDSVDKLFPSIWDYIKSRSKELSMTAYDPRPYVLLAVADKNNYRVQVYKYFWTEIPAEPDLYAPSLEHFATIGGRKGFFLPLVRPCVVSYSPTGELVVVDEDQGGRVYLLSQYFALIKKIDVPFSSVKESMRAKRRTDSGEARAGERNFLNGGSWPYWKKARPALQDQDGRTIGEGEQLSDQEKIELHEAARKHEKNAKWMGRGKSKAGAGGLMKGSTVGAAYVPTTSKGPQKTLEEIEKEEKQREQEAVLPVSAAFSLNGTLAVGYRNGGIFVYRPYKFYKCGNFEYLPLRATDRIISFLNYDEVGNMRNCCRFLHNHTKRLRSAWRIHPMREDKYDTVMFHFMRWAVNSNDDRPYYGKTPEVPKLQRVEKAGGAEDDLEERQHAKEEGLAAEAQRTPYDDVHFTDTSHCYPYADSEGDIICERYLQRICENPYCRQKHTSLQTLGYSQHFPGAQEAGLELKHLLLACYNVFDPRFVWQKERYIEKLFEFYSVPVKKLVRHEKGMREEAVVSGEGDESEEQSKGGEDKREGNSEEQKVVAEGGGDGESSVATKGTGKPGKIDYSKFSKRRRPEESDRQTRRVNQWQDVPLLSLEFFLEVMHFLEEDYSGARRIERHGLFLRTKKIRGGAPLTQIKCALALESEAKTEFVEEDSKARRRLRRLGEDTDTESKAESKADSSSIHTVTTGDEASLASHLESIHEEGEKMEAKGGDEGGDDTSTVDSEGSGSPRAGDARDEVEDAKGLDEGLTPYGPYDAESIEKRVYTDVLSQYDFSQPQNRINVPYKPLRPGNKKFLVMPGMQGRTQGVNDSEAEKYLHAYDGQVDRMSGLLGNLFK